MKLEDIKDVRVRKYVKKLEAKLEEFSLRTAKVNSYLSLKNFIEQGNKLLNSYKVSEEATELSDKDDKALERGLKFSEKLSSLQELLDKMYSQIGELPEDKGKIESSSSYEKALD